MSYRCSICRAVVPPGVNRLTHVVERVVPNGAAEPRKEVAAELPVCKDCKLPLAAGVPLAAVRRQRGRPLPVAAAVVKAHSPPPAPARLTGKVITAWRGNSTRLGQDLRKPE